MSILAIILMICFRRKIKQTGSVAPISTADHLEASDNIEEDPIYTSRERTFPNDTQGDENSSRSSSNRVMVNTPTYSKLKIEGCMPKTEVNPIFIHSLCDGSDSSKELRKTGRSPSCPIVLPSSSPLTNFSSNINVHERSITKPTLDENINQGLDIAHTGGNRKRRKLPKYRKNLILILYVNIYMHIYWI